LRREGRGEGEKKGKERRMDMVRSFKDALKVRDAQQLPEEVGKGRQ